MPYETCSEGCRMLVVHVCGHGHAEQRIPVAVTSYKKVPLSFLAQPQVCQNLHRQVVLELAIALEDLQFDLKFR